MSDREQPLALYAWLSPAFPVGAFAYSHGIEWAVESGDIRDAPTLELWLRDIVSHGALRNDLILCANAWRAARAGDAAALRDINELALALASSRERKLETAAQGTAFARAIRAAWEAPGCNLYESLGPDIAYPVALGIACAAHDIGKVAMLEAFALGFMANLTSAAVRLGPIGQTDGQRLTAALLPDLRAAAGQCCELSLDDLGGAAFRSDMAAMKHETQYSRLFRS